MCNSSKYDDHDDDGDGDDDTESVLQYYDDDYDQHSNHRFHRKCVSHNNDDSYSNCFLKECENDPEAKKGNNADMLAKCRAGLVDYQVN